ncbi:MULTISPECIES: glycosyltransferase family 4 protein [unclassified Pedobacter]|uniref:glycosyltransferase family 4 protein n=1 Tax=unclassified Pedobacter TaxID=2628915 RepID=UPI00141DE7CD|nr:MULTISPECIES: glycosyltransferase family 4 protein [unclassified Pedobacter]NII81321.1 glycosyltransferase involved in cell wall biosynthesis [Pedobacter sp. SG908]NMN35327.1 glycosyltransferase involved in cell wall biosynthesis [Pedobacter sp. SG918]
MPAKRLLVFCGGSFVFGAEIVTLSILKELKSSNIDIHCIVSGWNDGTFISRLSQLGIPYTEVKLGFFYISKPLWTLDTLINYPSAIIKIKKVIKDFKPDATYHTTFRTILMIGFLIKKIKNIFFVFDPHYGKLNKFYFKHCNKYTSLYVAVSSAIKDNLEKIGAVESKIIILRNGIQISNISLSSPYKNDNVLTFGIIGQIIERKGHVYVIKALNILIKQGYNLKIMIIGSGNEVFKEKLRTEIKDLNLEHYVEWKDFIDSRDILYSLTDIVLVPSITVDPLPTTAMEAGLYFKPVIVTDIGGLPEIAIHGKTGYIVKPECEHSLAKAMEVFLLNAKIIESFGQNAHKHITENFNVKQNIDPLKEYINI